MSIYWLSFRIAEDGRHDPSYEQRLNTLAKTVQEHSVMAWAQPTSFWIIESTQSIDELAAAYRKAIDLNTDHFIISMMGADNAIVCGKFVDTNIFKLMPYLRKLQ